jgi:hypothetical protein
MSAFKKSFLLKDPDFKPDEVDVAHIFEYTVSVSHGVKNGVLGWGVMGFHGELWGDFEPSVEF